MKFAYSADIGQTMPFFRSSEILCRKKVNESSIFTRKGYSPSVEFPRILGIECVGLVEESKKGFGKVVCLV